jgi:glycosyltransferase involved in cell wall biosynthesis
MHTTRNMPYFQLLGPQIVQNGPACRLPLSERDQKEGRRERTMAVSLIIPNRNGSATIGLCLAAAVRSLTDRDEIIVVDDCSTDGSIDIIRKYPCRLIQLDRHSGAARARNLGAHHSRGDILFFTDADCLVQEDSLSLARTALAGTGPGVMVGGTYTAEPQDTDFFGKFQSVFINHAETRRPHDPDYIASHAMALWRSTFLQSSGFPEGFLPIIEDVEFSHRLRRGDILLIMDPAIQVRHIFDFSLSRSLLNAVRKTRYWTRYSLGNRDLFADSGTASRGLKTNVAAWLASLAAASGAAFSPPLLALVPIIMGSSMFANASLLRAWWRTGGPGFGVRAAAYYAVVYPAAVAAGAVLGLAEHLFDRDRRRPAARDTRATEQRQGAYPAS